MATLKKIEQIKVGIKEKHGCLNTVCKVCTKRFILLDKLGTADVPCDYWFKKVADFSDDDIRTKVEEYMMTIKAKFVNGKSLCFVGNQGIGKTLASTLILKHALSKGFTGHYTNASDIFNDMMDLKGQNRFDYRKKLKEVDFLVIDELDSRFFVSDSAKEFFSGVYENIFRGRSHNGLPTIICTNNANNILDVFYGQSKQAIQSLHSQYLDVCTFAGKDFRKK